MELNKNINDLMNELSKKLGPEKESLKALEEELFARMTPEEITEYKKSVVALEEIRQTLIKHGLKNNSILNIAGSMTIKILSTCPDANVRFQLLNKFVYKIYNELVRMLRKQNSNDFGQ